MELWRRLKRKLLARPEQTVCEGGGKYDLRRAGRLRGGACRAFDPLSLLRNSLRFRAAGPPFLCSAALRRA